MAENLLEDASGVMRICSSAVEYVILLDIIIIYRCLNAPLFAALSAE